MAYSTETTRQFTVGNAKIQNRHGLFHGKNSPVYCRERENTKPPWTIPWKKTRQFTVGNAKIQNRHGLFHGNNSPVYCRERENTKPSRATVGVFDETRTRRPVNANQNFAALTKYGAIHYAPLSRPTCSLSTPQLTAKDSNISQFLQIN